MSHVYGIQDASIKVEKSLVAYQYCQLAGVNDSFVQLLLMSLVSRKLPRKLVVVLPKFSEVTQFAAFFESQAHLLPEDLVTAILPYISMWGHDRFVNPSLSRRQKLYALAAFNRPDQSAIVVTTLQALMQGTLHREEYAAGLIGIKVGDELDQDAFITKLEELGYRSSASVEEESLYAVRGGILDLYAPNRLEPLRIEFMGDEIASIREFSLLTQRSTTKLTEVQIGPAGEVLLPEATRKADVQRFYERILGLNIPQADRDGMISALRLGVRFSGFDMFTPLVRERSEPSLRHVDPKGALLCFPRSRAACVEAYKQFYEASVLAFQKDLQAQRPTIQPHHHFVDPSHAEEEIDAYSILEFGNPFVKNHETFYSLEGRATLPDAPLPKTDKSELFDRWVDRISGLRRQTEATVLVLAESEEGLDRICNLVRHRSLSIEKRPGLLRDFCGLGVSERGIFASLGDLASHHWDEEQLVLILPEHIIFGRPPKKQRPASAKLQNYLSSFKDLNVGDLVVHVQHGIAKYQGMQKFSVSGVESEFLILEYAGGDKIYLPVDRLNILQRYSASTEGTHAPLDRLGGNTWERKRAGVRQAVRDMADELLKIQAKRELTGGHAYSEPPDEYYKFEEEFPYPETEDQIRAIHDVQQDMMTGRAMDRLVCGDVGFGKTEVALRAAMRTVLEGNQVVVLVPTTVLCYQHYMTFKRRLEHHGVHVAQINRFVKSADAKLIVDGLRNGSVDVLVGTHRLLSKDIQPKKLGLLVVDEEQRFGVTHKEKLKTLRAQADVLTLTATPIPRTLHMAMLGLRDISIIATPPQDRLSVKTYVARFDEQLIKEAIEQEIGRGGQVFFVHNRVQDIEEVAAFLKRIVPKASINVAHGQMRETQLEKVIVDFIEQRFSVLLCTTIIESGIDMPNVNTLIVSRADRFGLAQLYQLRGRVGRSSAQAYAYFLTQPEERLTDEARQRLDVLAAHQELGAGFQIASYDLEIRGAGDLLGGEQSGHVTAVGLEMYTHLLEEAIKSIRGEVVQERVDTELKLSLPALIPADYVANDNHRLQLYKALFSSETAEELANLERDVGDRYGVMPPVSANLFLVAKLKLKLRECRVSTLSELGNGMVELKFAPLKERQIAGIKKVAARDPVNLQLTADFRLLLRVTSWGATKDVDKARVKLQELMAVIDPLYMEFIGS